MPAQQVSLTEALGQPMTQAEFGAMVGISQPAVSGLMKRGILLAGQTGQEWLTRYLTHLRESVIARLSGRGDA